LALLLSLDRDQSTTEALALMRRAVDLTERLEGQRTLDTQRDVVEVGQVGMYQAHIVEVRRRVSGDAVGSRCSVVLAERAVREAPDPVVRHRRAPDAVRSMSALTRLSRSSRRMWVRVPSRISSARLKPATPAATCHCRSSPCPMRSVIRRSRLSRPVCIETPGVLPFG
jgi:hypothetical protein